MRRRCVDGEADDALGAVAAVAGRTGQAGGGHAVGADVAGACAGVGVAEVGDLAVDLEALRLQDPGRVGVGDRVGEGLATSRAGGEPLHLDLERHPAGRWCPRR